MLKDIIKVMGGEKELFYSDIVLLFFYYSLSYRIGKSEFLHPKIRSTDSVPWKQETTCSS
jgi:hypothetical protein